jgi:hypothetical protein
MIDRYTIKFGPAVSQKELEKALHRARPGKRQRPFAASQDEGAD